MTFERSFINWSEKFTLCCWSAPSIDALADVFNKAGTPFDKMIEVEEHEAATLTS